MIRALILAIGLLLGLALVVLVEGRRAHLAAVMGDRLPGWAQMIAEDASALRGSAGPLAGRLALSADWRLAGIGSGGPVWRMQLSGPGMRLTGDLTLATDGTAHLDNISGSVDAAALAAWEHRPEFDADLQITRANATFDADHGALSVLQAEGLAQSVVLGQSALGDGRLTASRLADGRWEMHLTLADGQAEVAVDGDARGGILRLHVDEDRAELLPSGWGRPLPSSGNRLMVSHLLPIRPAEGGPAQR